MRWEAGIYPAIAKMDAGQTVASDNVSKFSSSVSRAEMALKNAPIPIVSPFDGSVLVADTRRGGFYGPVEVFLRKPGPSAELVFKFELERGQIRVSDGHGRGLAANDSALTALTAAFMRAAERAEHTTAPILQLNDLLAERGELPALYNPYMAHHRQGTIAYVKALIAEHGDGKRLNLQTGHNHWMTLYVNESGGVSLSNSHLDGRDVLTAGTSVSINTDSLRGGGYVMTRDTVHQGVVSTGVNEGYLWSQVINMIRTVEEKLGVRYPVK